MATIVHVTSTAKPYGGEVIQAVNQIRNGIAVLQKMDGVRAESIGVGQTEMQTNFGVSSAAEAQALSDRWSAFVAAWEGTGDTGLSNFRDMINAFVHIP